MTDEIEQRLLDAQHRLRQLRGSDSRTWRAAFQELHAAERAAARARGEPYAEPVDLGPQWDAGAPLPHLLTDGPSAFIVCRAHVPEPDWDGVPRMVSPADEQPGLVLVIEARGCREVRMGGPNDEALSGHALAGRGLEGYRLNEVHNSEWIEQAIRVNSVHPGHRDEPFRKLRHYVLPFHDDTVELLTDSLEMSVVEGTIRSVLTELVHRMT